jgi:hypothetical protein
VKILFLTDNFPPEVNAPASRTFEHCREWVRLGHAVTVVTGVPNFPAGKVFPGYRNRLRQVEDMDGIRVIRVWTYVAPNEGVFRRTLDFMSFMASGGIAALFAPRPDVIIGTSPQFFVAIAAYLASRLRGSAFVFELRDLWPQSISAVGAVRPGAAMKVLQRMAEFLYRHADGIVAVTSSFRDELMALGIDGSKISVVTNGADLSRFRPQPKDLPLQRRLGLEGKFVAGYVGTHGMAHGLETILDAAEILGAAGDADRFRIVLLGDGARKRALQAEAMRRGLANVAFLSTVSKDEVPRYWSLLDASIIHLKREPLFRTVIPSKLFESMAMGIPVLHGVEGESARIVLDHGVGRCFEPGNGASLAHAVRSLADDADGMQRLRAACLEAAPAFERGGLARLMLAAVQQACVARNSAVA